MSILLKTVSDVSYNLVRNGLNAPGSKESCKFAVFKTPFGKKDRFQNSGDVFCIVERWNLFSNYHSRERK